MSDAIFDHLWQSTLFAALVALVVLTLRRNPAPVRYGLWLAASVKFLLPFGALVALGRQVRWRAPAPTARAAASFVLDVMNRPFAAPDAGATAGISARTVAHDAAAVLPAVVVGIWIAGVAMMLATWLIRWRRLAIVVRRATPLTHGREVLSLRRREAAAGHTRPLPVVAVESALEPGIFGIFSPVLLWPRPIAAQLSDEEVDGILVHELAHARRRDNLTAAVHMIVLTLCWFHPLVWWIGARLVEERERACDEAVLRLGGEPQVYAESILKTCALCLEAPLACVAGVTGADLKKRVTAIMRGGRPQALGHWRRVLLAMAALAIVAVPLSAGVLSAPARRPQTTGSDAPRTGGNAPGERFEVASIKSNATGERRVQLQVQPGGRFTATNVTLRTLVRNAYQLQDFQITGGPDWMSTDHFDIAAKANGDFPDPFSAKPAGGPGALSTMLRNLLEERFQLSVRHENRELPIYALVRARVDGPLGPQLETSAVDCTEVARARAKMPTPDLPSGRPLCGLRISPGAIAAGGATLTQLANVLAMSLGRVIADKTDLPGTFDFDLAWTPDPSLAGTAELGKGIEPPADPGGPSIFTAIHEQLGLKLESQHGPVDVLVIERAAKPTEN